MTRPDIRLEETANGGRYAIRIEGQPEEAELTYRRRDGGVIVANHTYVPPAARGGGHAQALVERLIADARTSGLRIVPDCSYVALQFARHPEWADVRED